MQEVLPVLLEYGLCNHTALSSVNKCFRQVISGPQKYYQLHKLRYYSSSRRQITLVIRGEVVVSGRTTPKPNSTWTVEIWKGQRRKAILTIKYGTQVDSITLDLTACRVTGSKRMDHKFVHPDPWIVIPLCFVRWGRTIVLYDDPTLAWINQLNGGGRDVRYSQKPPRFLRVAFGYLGFNTFMLWCSQWKSLYEPNIKAYCNEWNCFLDRLK